MARRLCGLSLGVLACGLIGLGLSPAAVGQVCNVKVVTDANPDFSDIDSLIHSATARWPTTAEKCGALFYWVHIARRQTAPMIFHGVEVTDPIRQFNDFGYTMCSTVAGVNCGLWHHLGLPVRFWDVTLHSVSECFYDKRWHIYDNSMSAIYTLCDGRTIAGVEDLGRKDACEASDNRSEMGHVVKYHCLTATSPNGFLTGADCARDLAQESRCFNPNGLKLRTYYNNWDWGHRYILTLCAGESYTRHYHSLGNDPDFYVPNRGKDPEAANTRYHIRGNGVWICHPKLTADGLRRSAFSSHGVTAASAVLQPEKAGLPGEVVFKIRAANIIASQVIRIRGVCQTPQERVTLAVSTTAGQTWSQVGEISGEESFTEEYSLREEVNGSYEVLVKLTLSTASDPGAVRLEDIVIETRTMLNSKTQPQLRLGRNTVVVATGEPSDSIVVWPDLQGTAYRPFVCDEQNIATDQEHAGWHGVMYAEKPGEEAYTTYRISAPRPITRLIYGGRFYNRVPKGEIRLLHSFDGGKTWTLDWRLSETSQPWDDIHYVTVDDVPADTREVLVKYALQAPQAGPTACSIYSVRMEVQHQVAEPGFRPLAVTFTWDEIQADRSTKRRSHTQLVEKVPFRYTIDVGGVDHPVVQSLRVALAADEEPLSVGYSDDSQGLPERVLDTWRELGKNLLVGKPYTLSAQPTGAWGADDPDRRKLTDGVVGSNYAGGTAMTFAAGFDEKSGPVDITVDIGRVEKLAALGIHVTAGWPWWDALKGQVRDEIATFISQDGKEFSPCGQFQLNLLRRDVPINYMLPDDETAQAWNYILPLQAPLEARFVRFRVTPRRSLGITEVQAFDRLESRPFELRITLPDENP